MLRPCEFCGEEAVVFISLESCNEDPVGAFYFCCYAHVKAWIGREKDGRPQEDPLQERPPA